MCIRDRLKCDTWNLVWWLPRFEFIISEQGKLNIDNDLSALNNFDLLWECTMGIFVCVIIFQRFFEAKYFTETVLPPWSPRRRFENGNNNFLNRVFAI